MIKIGGKLDQPNTYNGFSSDISFFIQGSTSSLNEEQILQLNPV